MIKHDNNISGDARTYKTTYMMLIDALWRDIDEARPCFACKNHCKCDPNDDRFKMRFWEKCGEFSRPNWEWRGDNNG